MKNKQKQYNSATFTTKIEQTEINKQQQLKLQLTSKQTLTLIYLYTVHFIITHIVDLPITGCPHKIVFY